MGTIINGKIYRNVPGKEEGIEVEKLNIAGGSIYGEPDAITIEKENTTKEVVGQIKVSNTGVEISGDSDNSGDGYVHITSSSADDGAVLELNHEKGSLISYDLVANEVGKVEVSHTGVLIKGDVGGTGNGHIDIVGKTTISSDAPGMLDFYVHDDHDNVVGDIIIDSNGVTINADYDDTQNGYIKLQKIPTSDPKVEGAIWNDNGTLKISAGQ